MEVAILKIGNLGLIPLPVKQSRKFPEAIDATVAKFSKMLSSVVPTARSSVMTDIDKVFWITEYATYFHMQEVCVAHCTHMSFTTKIFCLLEGNAGQIEKAVRYVLYKAVERRIWSKTLLMFAQHADIPAGNCHETYRNILDISDVKLKNPEIHREEPSFENIGSEESHYRQRLSLIIKRCSGWTQ